MARTREKGTKNIRETVRMTHTDIRSVLRILSDSVDFEPLERLSTEQLNLSQGRVVTCTIGHKRTSVLQPLLVWQRKARRGGKFGKRSGFEWERQQGKYGTRKTYIFHTEISPLDVYD